MCFCAVSLGATAFLLSYVVGFGAAVILVVVIIDVAVLLFIP